MIGGRATLSIDSGAAGIDAVLVPIRERARQLLLKGSARELVTEWENLSELLACKRHDLTRWRRDLGASRILLKATEESIAQVEPEIADLERRLAEMEARL